MRATAPAATLLHSTAKEGESDPQPSLLAAAVILVCISTMLSTAQALRQWEGVLSILSEVKEFTATHPKQPIPSLAGRLSASCVEATKDLASPHVTWKKLLQSKVGTCGLCS